MENAKPHCIFHKAPVRIISIQGLPEVDPWLALDFSLGLQISEDISEGFEYNIGW